MNNDEMIRMRLSKELKTELQSLADRDNRKLSDFIRLALVRVIEKEKKRK